MLRKLIIGSGESFKGRVVETLNEIIDTLAARRIRGGPGVRVCESPCGITISADHRPTAAGGGITPNVMSQLYEWYCWDESNAPGGIYYDRDTGMIHVQSTAVFVDGNIITPPAGLSFYPSEYAGLICVHMNYSQASGFSGNPSIALASSPNLENYPIGAYMLSDRWGVNTYATWASHAPAVFIDPEKLNRPES